MDNSVALCGVPLQALCCMLGFASAKERKAFIKGLKQHCVAFATNAVDCVLLLRLLLTVDDTKLLAEQILKASRNRSRV